MAVACLLAVGAGGCLFPESGEEPPTCRERLQRDGRSAELRRAVEPSNGDRMRGADLVWPLSGTDAPEERLSGTFGPRVKVSEERYDFHRGIDLPADEGAAIHAVADGTVRLAGEDEDYSDPVVQIEHGSGGGDVFYSNYLHVSSWSVEAGETVEQGDEIARVGRSASGFPHLHFEIREGGVFRRHAVHPLSYLPYEQSESPTVEHIRVDRGDGDGRVSFGVRLPHTELDLVRIGVAVGAGDGDVAVSDFDMVRANAEHDDWEVLDDPEYRADLALDPEPFRSSSEQYRLNVTFRELTVGDDATVAVFTDDVGGKQTREYVCRP